MFLIDNQNRNRSGPSQIELRSAVEMMRSISTFINNNNSKKETSLPNYYKQIIQSQCHSVSATVEINVSQSQSHRGQREAFFQPREENENLQSCTWKRDENFWNFRLRDETEKNFLSRPEWIHYLQSQTRTKSRLIKFSRESDSLLATGVIFSKEGGCQFS